MTSRSLLTPKDLAEAVGASESSVRRWVDNGDIRIARTAGGHRRIPLPEAIRFIRQIGAPVIRPDLLGLGELQVQGSNTPGQADDEKLFESLNAGDGNGAKALLVSRFLEGQSLPTLFDGPVCAAFRRLGDLWHHDERGILIEHRATEFCIEIIATIRGLLPAIQNGAPLGLGGAPQGDPYQLPSMMAAAVLAESGLRDVNFGANTPVELLAREAIDRGAKLVWFSFSAPHEPRPLKASLRKLAAGLAKHQIQLILGGRHHLEYAPRHEANVILVQSMSELAGIAAGIVSDAR